MVYGWGDAPGYRMAWAVGAGGASSDYWYGEGFWNTALFPEGDVFVGGLMESDEYVFGAGTEHVLVGFHQSADKNVSFGKERRVPEALAIPVVAACSARPHCPGHTVARRVAPAVDQGRIVS